jgi:hypothetical protein
MKIISKFKDYYDFAAGYDPDPRKVFVREKQLLDKEQSYWDEPMLYDLSWRLRHSSSRREQYYIGAVLFCDILYQYICNPKTNNYYYRDEDLPEDIIDYFDTLYPNDKKRRMKYNKPFELLNKPFDCSESKWKIPYPIVYSHFNEYGEEEYVINGPLMDVKFGTIKTPQETFQELYNWIEFIEPPTDSSPTNMDRFASKGFDKKTSFRNIK